VQSCRSRSRHPTAVLLVAPLLGTQGPASETTWHCLWIYSIGVSVEAHNENLPFPRPLQLLPTVDFISAFAVTAMSLGFLAFNDLTAVPSTGYLDYHEAHDPFLMPLFKTAVAERTPPILRAFSADSELD
jgi:hypothetical protein